MKPKQPRVKDDQYLDKIRQCQCLTCGQYPSEAAHVRIADHSQNKPMTGKSEKPSDCWVLPLCSNCHRSGNNSQHSMNEQTFWEMHGINPIEACRRIFSHKNSLQEMKIEANKIRMGI